MKKLFLAFLMFSVIVPSCTKDNSIPETQTDIDLGFPGIKEGELHNDLVDIMIKNWAQPEIDEISIVKEINRILESNTSEFTKTNGFSNTEFLHQASICYQTPISSLENVVQHDYLASIGLSDKLIERIDEFYSVFNDIQGSEQVVDIKTMMLNHYQNNIDDLSKGDKMLYGAMVDVAIHSAEFWFPSEQGGQNKFTEFKSRLRTLHTTNNIEFRGFWDKIFLADCAGALTAAAISLVSTGGAAAIPNPMFGGIPTAGVVAVIGGAGVSIAKAL